MDIGDFIFLNHKINQNAYELAKNEIIFPIGISSENSITIQLTSPKDYSKKW
jgi:hypothetical protein